MAQENARFDANHVPTLQAVASTDGTTPTNVYADPATHRLLVQIPALSGAGAPASIPTFLGQIYIDTGGPDIYIASGTTNAADWQLVFDTP